jgi:PTS system mannose-specific IIA component
MIGIVIVTHGGLADGLVDAARMIAGEQAALGTVALMDTDAVDGLKPRVEEVLQQVDQGDGVLLLVDMMGASPFNVCGRLAAERDDVELITGVNLPMLLEVALSREGAAFDVVVGTAKQAGLNSIKVLSESLSGDGSSGE